MIKFTIIIVVVATIILALLPNIAWLIALLSGKVFGFNVSYSGFGWSALTLVVILWTTMAYGYFIGRWRLEVSEVTYSNKDIPATFNGYRIVHISDLHLYTFDDNMAQMSKIVDEINRQKPDLICVTGDVVNLNPEETLPYIPYLKELKARDGVVSVLGNHDFMLYSHQEKSSKEKIAAVDSLVNIQENKFGWKVLRNENIEIIRGRDSISIIGVDNTSCKGQGFQTISKGNLDKAIKGTHPFKVLLTHDPTHWTGEVVPDTDIQLTLSGHTHAAQISIFGWTPASWVFEQTKGRYDIGDQTLYVNIGLGCTVPLRIGATPEITTITFSAE